MKTQTYPKCSNCGKPWSVGTSSLCGDCQTLTSPVAITLAEICDLFGIGSDARTHATIITNVKNALRRSDILSMIEEHHSTFEKDEDGVEIQECPLRWGDDPDAYLARYVGLLDTALASESQREAAESADEKPDGQAENKLL